MGRIREGHWVLGRWSLAWGYWVPAFAGMTGWGRSMAVWGVMVPVRGVGVTDGGKADLAKSDCLIGDAACWIFHSLPCQNLDRISGKAVMTTQEWKNQLYFGDNLDILRNHVADASVDLIYLDPPFNSNANYNVLFQEKGGQQSVAQITAFEDTWHWSLESESAYQDVVTNAGGKLADLLQAMRSFLGENDMMAYLTMMAQRMVELHRVLKDTGSIYLHCDPTASHYLKLLMDSIFGPDAFRNEIIWKRQSAHSDARGYGSVHDTIFFYAKTDEFVWNPSFQPYDPEYVEQYYRYSDANGRRFMSGDLGASGLQGGGYEYEWKGITRVWRVPLKTMERLEQEDRVFYTRNGFPRIKRYLDESKGNPVQDVCSDIHSLRSWHTERLGYPTQKPEALLGRIVSASSNEGDVVLDPFCGCGTAIAAAERLNRRWIGIDVTHIAITLIRHRLQDTFKGELKPFEVLGQPQDVASAQALATDSEKLRALPVRVVGLGSRGRPPRPGTEEGRRRGHRRLHQLLRRQQRQGQAHRSAGEERKREPSADRHAEGRHGAGEGGDWPVHYPPSSHPPNGGRSNLCRVVYARPLPGHGVPAGPDSHHRGTAGREACGLSTPGPGGDFRTGASETQECGLAVEAGLERGVVPARDRAGGGAGAPGGRAFGDGRSGFPLSRE